MNENPDINKPYGTGADAVSYILAGAARRSLLTREQEIGYARQIQAWQEIEIEKENFLKKRGRNPTPKELCKKLKLEEPELERVTKLGIRAKGKLIEHNIRLVASIAKKYQERGMPFEDLIQEGIIGINRAAEKFDYTKGYKFSTYATWWIRQAISRGIINQAKIIRMPVHLVETFNHVKRATRELSQTLGRRPTQAEIAERLGITVEKLDDLYVHHCTANPYSLDEPVNKSNNKQEEMGSLGDMMHDTGPDPISLAEASEICDRVNDLLDCLPAKDAEVIRLRNGLDTGQMMTLAEVGVIMGLSRERVRQIQSRAMRRLRLQTSKMIRTGRIDSSQYYSGEFRYNSAK